MKKNRMMRLASILLVCVLLTTSVISGTFAKYTTSATGGDSARVAKWGFKTTELTVDLFAATYKDPSGNNDTVNAGSTKVIAPGTKNETIITLIPAEQINPEVSYTFDVDVEAVNCDTGLLAKLVWSLDGEEAGDFAALSAAIEAKYSDATVYTAGNLPAKTMKIAWEWPIDTDNVSDTLFGNDGTSSLTIQFSFTATQVD